MDANTVYLLDDEPGMRKALSRLLRAEGFAVHACATPQEFLKAYRSDIPSCLVLDVAMPDFDGLEVQAKLRSEGNLIPIIFLTGRGDIPTSVRAIKSGAVDFLTKPVNDTDLLRAVNAALSTAREQLSQIAGSAALATRAASLTPKEREVMQHVVAGKLNKQIAAELGTSEQNIKIHRGRVMQKMEVQSVADLVRACEKLPEERRPPRSM